MDTSNHETHNINFLLEDANKIPTYQQFFDRSWIAFAEFVLKWDKYPVKWNFLLDTFYYSMKNYHQILLIFFIAFMMTVMRYLFTTFIVKPQCKWLQLKRVEAAKLPEAVWRFLLYSMLWCLSVYYIFLSGEVDYFETPCSIFENITFNDNYFDQELPYFVTVIYFLQSAMYLHSTYATLFMDYVRSDFKAMMLHHAITCTLLILSYFLKFYKIGILVLYVHDATDILMEFAKINVYIKYRGNKVYNIHEYVANATFCLFTVAWIYYRLYLYPLKVLHASSWCVYILHKDKDPRLFSLFNSMLYFLQAIHIYWFLLILKMVFKMATGKMKEIDDIREEEAVSGMIIKSNGHTVGSKSKKE